MHNTKDRIDILSVTDIHKQMSQLKKCWFNVICDNCSVSNLNIIFFPFMQCNHGANLREKIALGTIELQRLEGCET
jgi:hypothetical protein